MKRTSLVITVFAAIVVASAGFMATSALAERQAKPVSHADTVTHVALEGGKANPNSIAVKVGSTVQFDSKDGQMHEMGEGEGTAGPATEHEHSESTTHDHEGEFSSGVFKADEAWKVTFNKTGTFFLHDHLHPDINILVVVYSKS